MFRDKQELGEFSEFEKEIGEINMVKKARDVLAIRDALKEKKSAQHSLFNTQLKGLLDTPPPKKDKG